MQGHQTVGRRTVTRRSPSATKETLGVIGAVALVVGLGLVLAPGPNPDRGQADRPELLPYQRLFRGLPPGEQLRYREILEGVTEVENHRAERGVWPEVNTLIEAGVPPFAPNPVEKGALVWTRRGRSPVHNYLGLPSGAAGQTGAAWLVLFQESGDRLGQEVKTVADLDEQHHLLSNGEIIHFSVWRRDQAPTGEDPILLPMAEGWTQILIAPEGKKAVAEDKS